MHSNFPKHLRLMKGLSSLTNNCSYLIFILNITTSAEIAVSGSRVSPGKSPLRPLPLQPLPSDLGAASISDSCPSLSFPSYAGGLLPLVLPFRQRFVNESLLCCMVALTSEGLEWDFPFHPKRGGSTPWRGLAIQSPARGIQIWRVLIKTQVSSEVVSFQCCIFCDCSATNILACSICLEVSFWTIQHSVYFSNE